MPEMARTLYAPTFKLVLQWTLVGTDGMRGFNGWHAKFLLSTDFPVTNTASLQRV
jgi:hypothetical protein